MPATHPVTGHCLCGRISLEVELLSRDVVYCHCSQCRRQSGHFFAATQARNEHLRIRGEEHIRWYAASADAQRGFCQHCGSALFWKTNGGEETSILAGCLDAPTGLAAKAHIFVADQGDYYTLDDGLPQYPQSD